MVTAADYITRTAGEPWAWGQTDCALWAASYVALVAGKDPATAVRGSYTTANGCRLMLMRAGGLLALSRTLMAGHENGGAGDGVAVARVGGRVIAGILSNDRLWLKSVRGVIAPEQYEILDRWVI